MPRPALFILGPASPDDPLDCVAAATPFLSAHYDAIHHAGPEHAISIRSMLREYDPRVDRLLYDFTAPADYGWALTALSQSPGAVLLAGRFPVERTGAFADLRSAQRYAAGGRPNPPSVVVGVLDAVAEPQNASILRRPAAGISAAVRRDDLALAVAPGAIETAYAALLGLARVEASVGVIASARRDANDLADIIHALQATRAQVRYARSRKEAATAACGVGGLIDIAADAQDLSDAGFAARCVGAPVLRLHSSKDASQQAVAFAQEKPDRDSAAARKFARARPLSAFANDLRSLIEAGHHRAQTGRAA